jgi:phosphatidylglycerophosphatase C
MDEGKSSKGKRLALFDFDGTLTREDTMLEFIKFVNGPRKLFWSMVGMAPTLLKLKLGLGDAEEAKRMLLLKHFKGMKEELLRQKAVKFCDTRLPQLFREDALEKLHFHRSRGHAVCIVTASLDLWIEPWLNRQHIHGICTQVAWEDGEFTGKFLTPNCNGPEKARRIRAEFDLGSYEKVFAYGDSKGDREMLALATKQYYRHFH